MVRDASCSKALHFDLRLSQPERSGRLHGARERHALWHRKQEANSGREHRVRILVLFVGHIRRMSTVTSLADGLATGVGASLEIQQRQSEPVSGKQPGCISRGRFGA